MLGERVQPGVANDVSVRRDARMVGMPRGEVNTLGTGSARWRGGADRLAQYAWLVLCASITVALAGGLVVAVIWRPSENVGGMPSLQEFPMILSMLGYGVVILLGMPSVLAAAWDFVRCRWRAGAGRLLVFLGPVLFLAGTEIVPHLLNPCFFALELWGKTFPGMCDYGDWGTDFASRWHLLEHTLAGAIPFAALYRLALRKWRPDVAHFRSPFEK